MANGYSVLVAFLQFLGSLAWPAAFVIVVLAFKGKISEILPNLKLKHKEWEISFRLEKAEQTASQLPPVLDEQAAPATPEERDRFSEIARISPRAAMLELRNELEDTVKAFALPYSGYGSPPSPPRTFAEAIRILRRAEVIDAKTSAILDDLRNIGNSVTHSGTEVTLSEAERYRKLATDVMYRLDNPTA